MSKQLTVVHLYRRYDDDRPICGLHLSCNTYNGKGAELEWYCRQESAPIRPDVERVCKACVRGIKPLEWLEHTEL